MSSLRYKLRKFLLPEDLSALGLTAGSDSAAVSIAPRNQRHCTPHALEPLRLGREGRGGGDGGGGVIPYFQIF